MKFSRKICFVMNGAAAGFRALDAGDVLDDYVQALRHQREFLENNPSDITLETQQAYVQRIIDAADKSIGGLFIGGQLIGTAGMQNLQRGSAATLGIFVLRQDQRGKGYGRALVWASCTLAHHCLGVSDFRAGMKKKNAPSLRSFLSCGFTIVGEDQDSYRVAFAGGSPVPPAGIQAPHFVTLDRA